MKKLNGISYRRYREMWEEYLTIKGGDFANWHEGLSPIEKIIFKQAFAFKQS